MSAHRICLHDGCDEPLDHLRSDALYHSAACRTAAYRQRALEARQNGNKASRRRHRTLDLRIAYGRVAARYGESAAQALLTDRQRAALEQRGARGRG